VSRREEKVAPADGAGRGASPPPGDDPPGPRESAVPPTAAELAEIPERVAAVRRRIAAAARRGGRDPAHVTLIGVSKRVGAEGVAAAVHAGLRDLGESYVQEAREKIPAVAARLGSGGGPSGGSPVPPRWHLVGRLQRNKAREAVALFDAVQSVDRPALARELARRAEAAGRRLPVLLQVDLSGEPQKGGVAPEALEELLELCAALPSLEVQGLMTIPAATDDPEASRPVFARLRELRDALRPRPGGGALRHLSMGMSADFEVAVEEGATLVRVGTAIFGPRAGGGSEAGLLD